MAKNASHDIITGYMASEITLSTAVPLHAFEEEIKKSAFPDAFKKLILESVPGLIDDRIIVQVENLKKMASNPTLAKQAWQKVQQIATWLQHSSWLTESTTGSCISDACQKDVGK